MRFIADSMLGRLAKWLRLLGYDTLYYPRIEDREILRIARADNRILLTRDTRLVKIRDLQNIANHRTPRPRRFASQSEAVGRRGDRQGSEYGIKYFFVNENNYFGQLKEIISAFNLKDFSIMSRCAVCNAVLCSVSKDQVKDLVPEYVYRTSDVFNRCSGCGKLYWKGTHPEKFREKLAEILNPLMGFL